LADFGTVLQINKPEELREKLAKKTSVQSISDKNSHCLSNYLFSSDTDDEGPVGTQAYISPEALKNDKKLIGFGTDLWSLGVIIW
jgi:serine/threonine protein kinase